MDVDGTLTDGKIYMGPLGEAIKVFNIKDGCGIKDLLPQYDIIPIIITARSSEMLRKRCEELGICELHQDVRNKLEKLLSILEIYSICDKKKYSLSDCAYIGDDILDLQCMMPIKKAGGIVGCPADASLEVRSNAEFISQYNAGHGAVRDFIYYLTTMKKFVTLEERVNSAIEFVSKIDLISLDIGKYKIDDYSYYMVQEYSTRDREYCKLESHKEYVDVQWIVSGQEEIDVVSLYGLNKSEDYDSERDVIFWEKPSRMQRVVLGKNSYVVLYPEDAHMPCISVNGCKLIKKVVIKIKI